MSHTPDHHCRIEQMQQRKVINRSLGKLTPVEQVLISEYAAGKTYFQIGMARDRSTTWAFYQVRDILNKLRFDRDLKNLATAWRL